MSQPDLPENLSLTIVRRWECEKCGAWGSVRTSDNRCHCDMAHESNSRHLQFTIRK